MPIDPTPPPDPAVPDPAASAPPAGDAARRQTMQEMEGKHFIFATILVIGSVLALPTLGALYVLMIRWGWLTVPGAQ